MTSDAIRIVAAVALDARGIGFAYAQTRRADVHRAGGKLEASETPIAALQREIAEALEGSFDAATAAFLADSAPRPRTGPAFAWTPWSS